MYGSFSFIILCTSSSTLDLFYPFDLLSSSTRTIGQLREQPGGGRENERGAGAPRNIFSCLRPVLFPSPPSLRWSTNWDESKWQSLSLVYSPLSSDFKWNSLFRDNPVTWCPRWAYLVGGGITALLTPCSSPFLNSLSFSKHQQPSVMSEK